MITHTLTRPQYLKLRRLNDIEVGLRAGREIISQTSDGVFIIRHGAEPGTYTVTTDGLPGSERIVRWSKNA